VVDTGWTLVRHLDGARLLLGAVLGSGGEGTVYAATNLDRPGPPMAVKWYHVQRYGSRRHQQLERLVELGPPSDRFLWPDSMCFSPDEPTGLGYCMTMRPEQFVRFDQIIARSESLPFAVLATIGRNLADSFHALHAAGLCYRDIKDANVFVRATDGEVLVCDNDNVSIEDEPAGVRGSLYYMPPEVMLGTVPPSRRSDQFSLAVLLFYLLVHHHPLEGRRTLGGVWDAEAQLQALAREPLFVFDPQDQSNRPDPDLQPLPLVWWPLLPGYLRALFTRTFAPGLSDPGARVTETQWREALDDLRASVRSCTCGAHNLHDPDVPEPLCWNCQAGLTPGPVLRPARPRGRRPLQLEVGATLTAVNTSGALHTDHRQVVGIVEAHPSDPSVRGIRNLGALPWVFRSAEDATVRPVAPGQVLRVRPGSVDFSAGHTALVEVPGA
jgi:DNA-binding helix-hairpin-helix protein with protein kinase domain